MMKAFITSLVFLLALGCATNKGTRAKAQSQGPSSKRQVADVPDASRKDPVRYLAWLQGDYQSGYGANKKEVRDRLSKWGKQPPTLSDREDYLEYASLLDAANRSKEAEKRLHHLLSVDPNESRATFILANLYFRQKKKEVARYLYNRLKSNRKFPWKSLLHNNLGMMALEERNRRLALAEFQKAISSKPPSAAPYVNLGALYLQSHSFQDAEKMFRRATKIDEAFEDAIVGLGSALEGLGRYKEAHKTYDDYLDDYPKAMTALYNDAILLGKRLNRRSEAAQKLLSYVQRGGKATAKAQEFIRNWR